MKKTLAFVLFFFFAYMAGFCQKIQEKDLPAYLPGAFKSQYPEAENPEWSKDSLGFTVAFVKQDMHITVLYDANGRSLKTDWEIPPEYTPSAIKEYFLKNFKKFKIVKLFYEEATEGKFYKTEIAYKKNHHTLFFKLNGEFVKELSLY